MLRSGSLPACLSVCSLFVLTSAGGGGLIRRLDVEQQLEVLPSSHSQWPMWMSEMFDHAEMVEQVRVITGVTQV
jgi:hypothetical protein